MSISASEAAKLTGMSKQGIINAINSGKISAVKDIDGRWQIEPVELFRVYPAVSSSGGTGRQEVDDVDAALPQVDTPSIEALQVEVRMLREVLDTKDDVISAKEDTIADLRARLNVEQEERRRLSMMLTAAPAPASKPKGFWQRLLGGA
jgi:hypothetical protein